MFHLKSLDGIGLKVVLLMRRLIIKAVATGFMSEKKTHTCFVGPCNQQLSEEDTHAARNMTSKKELMT